MATPPLSDVIGEELEPGTDVQTDDEILDYMRHFGQTTYHPIGTCKMGRDPMAVVDEKLRVHGLEGLRVADASIMPTITSGNTNAPSMMIGEKCADDPVGWNLRAFHPLAPESERHSKGACRSVDP